MNACGKAKCLILTCLCMVILAGCAGFKYTDKVDPVRLDQKVQKRSAKVYAQADEWRNSGVIVQKDASYQISARGRWHAGILCGWTSPSGVETHGSSCPPVRNVVKKWSAGALIGKIGENGEPFGIGYEYVFTPKEEGVLYLRINDCFGCTVDNDGVVDVAVVRTDSGMAGNEGQARVSPAGQAGDDAGLRPVQGQKWAVIVGISSYKDSRIEGLRYAAADAKAFHDWLISQKGGRYAPSRVRILLDSEATSRNIRNALFNWLGQVLEEDTVMIYFAGHGSPQSPDQPQNLFLLPYDCQYDDVATTGFPMWDIETALKRFIKAKKVVVIADACHSGGIGRSFDIARRAARGVQVNPISSGIQTLSKVGEGVAVISASDDRQFSQEGRQWGGGHGVFTHFLLTGLNGGADYNRDGHVTLGELIPFLSEQVRRETGNAQSPTVSGKFDPALTIGH
ncbi:MAG TPA: caspase family protein [Syntrophales bacterium]|nr:caspase family protein [Syntrophales bacterium]